MSIHNYELKASIEGVPIKIRELDPVKDETAFFQEKDYYDVMKYFASIGDGKVLVTDADYRFYAEEGKGVYAFIQDLSLEWLESNDFKGSVEYLRKLQNDAVECEDYAAYFDMIPIPMRMYEFEKIYKQIEPYAVSYVWLKIYTDIDYNASFIKKSVFNHVCKYREKFDSDEEIIIYRGEANESQSYEKTLSWTTDINIAIFFATRYGAGRRILRAKVKRRDILFDYNGRGEHEIIVKAENVYDVEHMDFYDCIEAFRTWKLIPITSCCENNMALMFELYPEDSWHDIRHIIRVLAMTKLISDELKMSEKDTELAILCVAYHDCGRKDDNKDIEHGKRSAEILEARESLSDEDMAIAKTVIEYHCLDDIEGEKAIEENKQIIDKERALKIYYVLKDADALDRLRFGRGDDGLKYDMLRFPESKRCTLIAGYCAREGYAEKLMHEHKNKKK